MWLKALCGENLLKSIQYVCDRELMMFLWYFTIDELEVTLNEGLMYSFVWSVSLTLVTIVHYEPLGVDLYQITLPAILQLNA